MIDLQLVRTWALLAYPESPERRGTLVRQLSSTHVPAVAKDRLVSELVDRIKRMDRR